MFQRPDDLLLAVSLLWHVEPTRCSFEAVNQLPTIIPVFLVRIMGFGSGSRVYTADGDDEYEIEGIHARAPA